MINPIVSILIPVYNRVNLVQETIESAINQTYRNIEIIIIDNCSNDGTWELLQEYSHKDSRIRVFQNDENIGPVRNWKRCIEKANGEYSKILFSDDIISPNFIEETLSCFNSNTAFVISNILVFDKTSQDKLGSYTQKKIYAVNEYLEDKIIYNKYKFPDSPGCALFRKSDLINSIELNIVNPWNLDFNTFGAGVDLLIFFNCLRNYSEIGVSVNSAAYFRKHEGSFTMSNKLYLYYEYSKLYFIFKHRSDLLKKFKSLIFLRMLVSRKKDPLFEIIPSKKNSYSIFTLLINKLLS